MNHDVLSVEQSNRRAVVRIAHVFDEAGQMVDWQLEPLPGAACYEVAVAAYHAARRCHPWIVSDEMGAKFDAAKRVALDQVLELLRAADEALYAVDQAGELTTLQADVSIRKLREAATDLRGYMPALHNQSPPPPPPRATVQHLARRTG